MSVVALVILAIIVLFLIIVVGSSVRIVRPYQRGLVEQLGKYKETHDPGLHLIIPFVQAMRLVDMREQVVDVPPQEVITSDNVVVAVDAVIYYEPTDPQRLLYNVANFILAVTKLAQTNLRNVIGDMQLDQALTSRDTIHHGGPGELRHLGHQVEGFGLEGRNLLVGIRGELTHRHRRVQRQAVRDAGVVEFAVSDPPDEVGLVAVRGLPVHHLPPHPVQRRPHQPPARQQQIELTVQQRRPAQPVQAGCHLRGRRRHHAVVDQPADLARQVAGVRVAAVPQHRAQRLAHQFDIAAGQHG